MHKSLIFVSIILTALLLIFMGDWATKKCNGDGGLQISTIRALGQAATIVGGLMLLHMLLLLVPDEIRNSYQRINSGELI